MRTAYSRRQGTHPELVVRGVGQPEPIRSSHAADEWIRPATHRCAMSEPIQVLEIAVIAAHCKPLRLPTIAASCEHLAQEAIRERHTHLQYLDALLEAELEERRIKAVARRIQEARLPQVKTLDEFDFAKSGALSAPQILALAGGEYLLRKEPILFLGDCGTGKTHLASGLCVAACRQLRKVRFVTAAGLVNDLLEAQHLNQLGRALSRWARFDLRSEE